MLIAHCYAYGVVKKNDCWGIDFILVRDRHGKLTLDLYKGHGLTFHQKPKIEATKLNYFT